MSHSPTTIHTLLRSVKDAIAEEEKDPGHPGVLPCLKGARTQLQGALNARDLEPRTLEAA